MADRFISLGARLSATIVAIVVVIVVVLLVAVPSEIQTMAADQAARRADGVASSLAIAVQAPVEFDDEAAVAELLQRIGTVDDVVYGVVTSHDQRELGRWVRSGVVLAQEPQALHQKKSGRTSVSLDSILHVAVDIETKDPAQRGRLYLGFSTRMLDDQLRSNTASLLLLALAVVVIGVAAGLFLGNRLAMPIRHLADVTTRLIAAGDLRVDVDIESNDETGLLAKSFSEMVSRLRAILVELKATALGLPQISERLSATAQNVVAGANTVLARANETSSATTSTLGSLDAGSRAVSTLDLCVDRANQQIGDMQLSNGAVAQQLGALVASVDETVTAVELVTRSVDDTAGAVRAHDEAMGRMIRSVQTLEGSTRLIEETAARTAGSATETQENAVAGVRAIQETLAGITEIHAASQTAAALIRELDERTKRIDTIVDVIREVADQTTLFSLNAAIISAQAGEHGRAFAVVGSEIKALAQRTASSTTEIGRLLSEIQDGSQRARVAMEHGMAAVEVGVGLGNQAAAALQRISSSADASVAAAAAIAGSTAAQVRGTRELNGEMQRIANSIARISQSSALQSTNSVRLLDIARQMKTTTANVDTSARDQRLRSEGVRQALEEITETAAAVRQQQQHQAHEARRVLDAVVAMQQAARQETEAAQQLDETTTQLQARADGLQAHLGRFRL